MTERAVAVVDALQKVADLNGRAAQTDLYDEEQTPHHVVDAVAFPGSTELRLGGKFLTREGAKQPGIKALSELTKEDRQRMIWSNT